MLLNQDHLLKTLKLKIIGECGFGKAMLLETRPQNWRSHTILLQLIHSYLYFSFSFFAFFFSFVCFLGPHPQHTEVPRLLHWEALARFTPQALKDSQRSTALLNTEVSLTRKAILQNSISPDVLTASQGGTCTSFTQNAVLLYRMIWWYQGFASSDESPNTESKPGVCLWLSSSD